MKLAEVYLMFKKLFISVTCSSILILLLSFLFNCPTSPSFMTHSWLCFWTKCFQNIIQCSLKLKHALNPNKNHIILRRSSPQPKSCQKTSLSWLQTKFWLLSLHVWSEVSHIKGLSSGSSGCISDHPSKFFSKAINSHCYCMTNWSGKLFSI